MLPDFQSLAIILHFSRKEKHFHIPSVDKSVSRVLAARETLFLQISAIGHREQSGSRRIFAVKQGTKRGRTGNAVYLQSIVPLEGFHRVLGAFPEISVGNAGIITLGFQRSLHFLHRCAGHAPAQRGIEAARRSGDANIYIGGERRFRGPERGDGPGCCGSRGGSGGFCGGGEEKPLITGKGPNSKATK